MSYQVLARKWRPGKFSELVGQEHVVSAISNALDNDRLHHAYLFTGTRGVGKTTIARIFSKSLNCEEGQGASPCGQCATCKEIEQGNYVDLLEIDAASRTKVEDTRELLDNVQYKPTRGRYKVYLIDEVHMLSKHSFNALLKTLEEPPPHVKFLLATTDPQKLPITILSRCLQFNLKAMLREQIVGQLSHILEQENLPFEPQALSLLARAAQGSMRDALSLTDQAIAQGGNSVVTSVVTDMLGLMDKNHLLKVVHAVVNKQPADVMQLVTEIAEQAPDYGNVHSELISLLHQIALTQWVPEACKLETTSAKAIYQLAKSIPAEQVQLLYQVVLQGKKDLPFASDGKSALEMTLMRMMSFAPSVPLADTQSAIDKNQSEHSLPVDGHNASGGPGNVSKQEEAHLSETLAIHNTESDVNSQRPLDKLHDRKLAETTEISVPDASGTAFVENTVVDNNVESNCVQLAADKSEIDSLHTGYLTTENNQTRSSVVENNHPVSSDAASKLHGNEVINGGKLNNEIIHDNSHVHEELHDQEQQPTQEQSTETEGQTTANETLPLNAYIDEVPSRDEYDPYGSSVESPAEHAERNDVDSNEPVQTPEEQLTSTADMLALRQKLKQRKIEEADNKGIGAKEQPDTAEQIQARFVKASASISPVIKQSEAHVAAQHTANDSTIYAAETSASQTITPPRIDTQHDDSQHGEEHASDTTNHAHAALSTDQNTPNNTSLDEFDSDEFDADIPFSNDDVHYQAGSEREKVHSDEQHFEATQIEHLPEHAGAENNDAPPWAMDNDASSLVNTVEQIGNDAVFQDCDDSTEPRITSDGLGWESLEFDAPLSETYNGSLKAYLDSGQKLTHASQIDSWSNLVEQMPVAGLLKQLVLHAAFSRHENTVSLEIHNSQAHLLNANTKEQLIEALRQGMDENVEVVINLGEPTSTPFSLQQEIHAMRYAHAHAVIKTDNTIQALLSTFDASVLADTVKAR